MLGAELDVPVYLHVFVPVPLFTGMPVRVHVHWEKSYAPLSVIVAFPPILPPND